MIANASSAVTDAKINDNTSVQLQTVSHPAPHGTLTVAAGTADLNSPWDIQRAMHHEN